MRLKDLGVVFGRAENRQPAIGDLGGQLHVLWADRGQVDREIGPPMQDALERLTQPGRIRPLVGNLVV